ncbi:hypothetical protein I601_3224 [Nocardioides dokdonensis FR1436]|uniref:Uncharacterized protein n=1 Tax=Nocardioides dokdonensis FR1436 TaxID=1300347 RepID=A0A1A9GQ77_9ACTN|nr:hypothetical protein [Nocardioides dokdonensis]ANH39631.1 hypothetical protein I601_3224 [Nocardioides dokdonensis FR1436]
MAERVEAVPPEAEHAGVVLGWICGLGLLVVPWIGAGVLATLASFGPESWAPERSFPWLLLAGTVGWLGWLVVASLRLDGFRRGAVPGTAIAIAVIITAVVLIVTLA